MIRGGYKHTLQYQPKRSSKEYYQCKVTQRYVVLEHVRIVILLHVRIVCGTFYMRVGVSFYKELYGTFHAILILVDLCL